MARCRYRVVAVGPAVKHTPAAQAVQPALEVSSIEVNAVPAPDGEWGKGTTFASRAPNGVIGFTVAGPEGQAYRVGYLFYVDLSPATPAIT